MFSLATHAHTIRNVHAQTHAYAFGIVLPYSRDATSLCPLPQKLYRLTKKGGNAKRNGILDLPILNPFSRKQGEKSFTLLVSFTWDHSAFSTAPAELRGFLYVEFEIFRMYLDLPCAPYFFLMGYSTR